MSPDPTPAPSGAAGSTGAGGAPAQFLQRLRASLAEGRFVKLQLARPHPPADPTLDKLLARRVHLRGADHLSLVWRHRSKDITKNLPLDEACTLIGTLLAGQFHHAHLLTTRHDVQLVFDRKGRWALRVGKVAAPEAAGPPPAAVTATAGAPTASPAGGALDGPSEGPPDVPSDNTRDDSDPSAGRYLGQIGRRADGDGPPDAARPALAHDRLRQHALSLETPFLAALGVAERRGSGPARLVPAMARKWRQINKFVEVLGQAIERSPLAARQGRADATPVRVLDFGAGKGYLTFAVHHWLQAAGYRPEVLGVELRENLTAQGNDIVARLGLQGLGFATGDVRSHQAAAADVMIALHACDTATDVALHRGVLAGAALIVASPCCHKQLRPQLQAPAALAPLLRHGIHQAQQAEMLTDALRALTLQIEGYDAQVFEFISPEATSKNKLVLAVRRARPLPAAQVEALRRQAEALKAEFGITDFALDALFRGESVALDSSAAAAVGLDED